MELGFKEVEELFALRYAMAQPTVAFRGRLQHLQRNEFPDKTVNPGKGKKAVYAWEHIFQLSVALDLIDVGITPDAATSLVRSNRRTVLLAASSPGALLDTEKLLKAVKDQRCPFTATVFITTAAHALFAFGAAERRLEPVLNMCSGKDLIEGLKGDNPYDASATYIDVGKRVMLTLNHIAFDIKGGALQETVADYENWAVKHGLDS